MPAGARVQVKEVDGKIVINPPLDMETVRVAARAEMEAAGTWGTVLDADAGWIEQVQERYGSHA